MYFAYDETREEYRIYGLLVANIATTVLGKVSVMYINHFHRQTVC
jgi:hypothetical protein